MTTKRLYPSSKEDLLCAAQLILQGKLVAFPTETVYGLGGNALMPDAAQKIYTAKGRPQDNPLIIHLASYWDAEKYCVINPVYYRLAQAFMPGPITVVLPKKPCIPDSVTGGLSTVAIRVPAHPVANALISAAGVPIAAPSANASGKPSPTKAEHVIADLDGKIDAVLMGDACEIGVESTIVLIDTNEQLTLLRPGAITYEMLCDVMSCEVKIDNAIFKKTDARPLAPGMKYRHYAPHMPVTVISADDSAFYDFVNAQNGCAVLCYEQDLPFVSAKHVVSLGDADSPQEQAYRLFDCLRILDTYQDIDRVYARMPRKEQVGLAVWNRLAKASGFDFLELT